MNRAAPHVLVARQDSVGDVLLMGPAIRAVAAGASKVTMVCGPQGEAAARLLPGVDEVIVHAAPWIASDPAPVDRDAETRFVDRVAGLGVDQAIVFTSFHQSPLPMALLLRFAGVSTIAAISVDYPGALLDVRHRVSDDIHEVERALSLVATLGYELPSGDDGRLQIVRRPGRRPPLPGVPYVVVHPGASVPARAWSPSRMGEAVGALVRDGWHVVVTGAPAERELCELVAGAGSRDVTVVAGATDLSGLADLIAGAAAIVVGNTGPAHVAAAVGTPTVSLFAPTVPAARWRPWMVPLVLLGDHGIACAGCRARICPIEGHPCLSSVSALDVVAAVRSLVPSSQVVAVT